MAENNQAVIPVRRESVQLPRRRQLEMMGSDCTTLLHCVFSFECAKNICEVIKACVYVERDAEMCICVHGFACHDGMHIAAEGKDRKGTDEDARRSNTKGWCLFREQQKAYVQIAFLTTLWSSFYPICKCGNESNE